MSDALYATRLRWDSRRGVCKLAGLAVEITTAPDLGSGPVHSCDYVPEVHIAEVQPRACDCRRDMLPAEIQAARALLRSCAGKSARNSANQAPHAADAPRAHL